MLCRENDFKGQILLNWFYGGYVVSVMRHHGIDLVDLEYVKPGLRIAVAELGMENKLSVADIGFWILLGYCLRSGDYDLLERISRDYGFECGDGYVLIPSWRGSVTVFARDRECLGRALESINPRRVYTGLVVDNNGLRHIVKLDRVG